MTPVDNYSAFSHLYPQTYERDASNLASLQTRKLNLSGFVKGHINSKQEKQDSEPVNIILDLVLTSALPCYLMFLFSRI